jgi:GntR family transcriptional regulator
MKLTINTNDRSPVYRQIADGIKTLIAMGDLAEGASLPPVRQLAADLGLNLNTIAVAYRELQHEGLILLKPGSGAKVAARGASPTQPPKRTQEELRRPLRLALTEFVLAGVSRREILKLVDEELRGLLKGTHS